MKRSFLAHALLVSALLVPSAASAADPVAERLYKDGRAAAQAKDWTKACAMFQESQNREPAPGTLLNLADCEEHRGRLVTASAQYLTASRLFPAGDPRGRFAADKAAALEKRTAKLRIRTEPNTSIEFDGATLDASSLGNEIPTDPGTHVLVAKAEGHADARSTVVMGEGESRTVDLKPGPATSGAVAATPVTTPSPEPAPAPKPEAPRSTEPAPSHEGPSKVPAYVLLGTGGVALGVGIVTGVMALGSAKDVRQACPGGQCQDEAQLKKAHDSADSARSLALVSTIGVGVGVVAAAVGTYLFVRASSSTTIAPAVGTNGAGLVAVGTF